MNGWRRILVATWLTAGAGMGIGEVIRVPVNYPSIQQGLDAVLDGDTVLVADSIYAEALMAPPLRFWLLGDVIPDSGDFARPTIDVSLLPDSVHQPGLIVPSGAHPTIERFRFRNSHDMSAHGLGGVVAACDTVIFTDCSFDSCFWAISPAWPGAVFYLSLERCVFRHYWSNVYMGPTEVHASNCTFSDIHHVALRCGDGSVIESCQFRDIFGNCVQSYYHRDVTICDCLFGPFQDENISGLLDFQYVHGTIERNVFTQVRSFSSFIFLEADSDLGATVADNTFYDCQYAGTGTGGQLLNVFSTARVNPAPAPYFVTHNVMAACTLGDWAIGINACDRGALSNNRFHDLAPSPTIGVPAVHADSVIELIFRENLFYHNYQAMSSEAEIATDARWNWWGDSTGPYHAEQNPFGHGDRIVGNVDFIPFYPDTSFLSVPGIGRPLPEQFVLEAYPNPFNSVLHLTLVPSEIGIVKVELFDILGRKINELWHGPLAFQKEITFDASGLSSGIYFARVSNAISRKNVAMAKVVLLK